MDVLGSPLGGGTVQSPEGISPVAVAERRETETRRVAVRRTLCDGSVRYQTGTNRKWISSLVGKRVNRWFEYETFAKQFLVSR